jgi:single-strand DNA-binding protein
VAVNESSFSVAGYVASDPQSGLTRTGVPTMTMRLAWTPRKFDPGTRAWGDEPSCFATVKCWRSLAENGVLCLRKGMPVVVSGTLRVRDYVGKDGNRRTAVDILATSIGHDLSRGIATFRKVRPPEEQPADDQQPSEERPSEAAHDSFGALAAAEDQEVLSSEAGDDPGQNELDVPEDVLDQPGEAADEPVGASV